MDKRDKPGENALKEVEDIGYGTKEKTLRGKDVTVKDHLPLDASVSGKEG